MHSACILCSNGCGPGIAGKDGRIAGARGSANHPVNSGHLATVRQGADLHLQLRRGTNVALMNGIIHLLITGRSVYHYCTRTKTSRSMILNGRAPRA